MTTSSVVGNGVGSHRPKLRRDGPGRITGIDAARAVALVGMMATHLFPIVDDDGNPTVAWALFAGRSAALFVFLAGVGIALTTGGAQPPRGARRLGAAVSLATRAAVLTAIGLALGHLVSVVDLILVSYGVLFLLTVPLLTLSWRALAATATVTALVAPFLVHGLRDHLPEPTYVNPSFASLDEPGALVGELLFTGVYPAVALLAYVCAGMAIGRLIATAAGSAARMRILAIRLFGVGAGLALTAWVASAVLLNELGGLDRIRAASPGLDEEGLRDILLWGPNPTLPTSTWWWQAIRAPHSSTPIDVLHTAGTSMAVLGAMLLLGPTVTRALRPLIAAGTMTLTLYSLHVLVTETGVLDERPAVAFAVQVVAFMAIAFAWRAWLGQGPLERAVSSAARLARDAVRPEPKPRGPIRSDARDDRRRGGSEDPDR
jgi:hypothetical protein